MNLRILALFLAGGAACTSHAPAALAVDTPLVPYQAPDLAELTGQDEQDEQAEQDQDDREDSNASGDAVQAAPQVDTKQPATPAKAGK